MKPRAERLFESLELAGATLVFEPWTQLGWEAPDKLRSAYHAIKASYIELGRPVALRPAVVEAGIRLSELSDDLRLVASELAPIVALRAPGYWLETYTDGRPWRLVPHN